MILRTSNASKYLGVSINTLKTLSNNGKVKSFKTDGGHRRFRQEDLDAFAGKITEAPQKVTVVYARCSTAKQIVDRIVNGDLFVTSWGYDQTNYDFIVVLELSKTGKTAKCQRTAAKNMGASGTSDLLYPINEPFGDVFTMHVRTGYKGDLQLKGSYPFCCNGSMVNTRLDRFSRVENNRQYHETNSMFGH